MATAERTPPTEKVMTADEFFFHPLSKTCELVKGKVVVKVSPTNYQHGRITLKLGRLLGNFVAEHDLGDVLGAETGYTLQTGPDTVRAPDVSFVRKARRPATETGFPPLAPDLAVEVVSPNDSPEEVQEKVQDYLAAGTRIVWVVYPKARSVTVYHSLSDIKVLRAEDLLSGEDVLPGFERKVSEIFE